MTMRWNAGSEYIPAPTLVVEPQAEAREQSWAGQRAAELSDLQPDETMTFAKAYAMIRGPIRVDSWLVSLDGKAMFVSSCQPFIKWYVENNPGAVVEDVTADVPSALARTAVVNE